MFVCGVEASVFTVVLAVEVVGVVVGVVDGDVVGAGVVLTGHEGHEGCRKQNADINATL